MLKHSRKNVLMIALIAVIALFSAYFFILLDSEERPYDAILSVIRDEGHEPIEIRNQMSIKRTEKGLNIKHDNREEVKVRIQGAAVGSFSPTQSQSPQ